MLFKKIDSLWRGNVGAEVAALTDLGCHVLVAGALPQLRRTVVDGRPYADGVPLAGTGLWHAESASPPSRVADVLAQSSAQALDLAAVRSPDLAERLRQLFSGDDAVTVVADGETEADLEAVVDALAQLEYSAGGRGIVLVGTGGIAAVLAQTLRPGARAGASIGIPVPARNAQTSAEGSGASQLTEGRAARPVLAVVGSASGAARRQLRELQAGGFVLVGLSPEELRQPGTAAKLHGPGGPGRRRAGGPDRRCRDGGSPRSRRDRQEPGALRFQSPGPAVARRHRRAAADVVLPDLILTGGETAREVLERLGIRALEPLGAEQHGAVVSLADDGRLVGTKPGSFGDDLALLQLYHSIQSRRASEPAGTASQKPLDPSAKSGETMNSVLKAAELTATDLKATAQDTRPVIAVTMGDGAGVGPEVTVGALLAENAYRDCRPVVIGDVYRLELGAEGPRRRRATSWRSRTWPRPCSSRAAST